MNSTDLLTRFRSGLLAAEPQPGEWAEIAKALYGAKPEYLTAAALMSIAGSLERLARMEGSTEHANYGWDR
jgi:hypothetical protein